ncbi:hypothetical protein VTI74DRAFT_10996 [Chaetomium olivicolor]
MPHEVRSEEPPPSRFHEPAFQRALADTKFLMANLASALDHHGLEVEPDSTIRDLQERAKKLAQFQCPPTLTVGLVGDSGVGKSSLINSLLDCEGLAREGNASAACTCVITEYLYHDRDDFIVDVEPFTEDELMGQLAEMVHAYCLYHQRPANVDAENSEDAEDRKYWEERATLAQDTFHAMFQNRFTPALFQSGLSEEAILEIMADWARELGPADVRRREVKVSLQDCSDLLEELTSAKRLSQGPPTWRYIKKIRVFLKAHILSRGLILVDLPGLRDLNSARRNITERYLVKCNEIFAVCNIIRATTDQGVMGVFELARRARLSNVGIVCTRSEDISPRTAVTEFAVREVEQLQRLNNSVERIEKELALIEEDLHELEYDDLSEEDEAMRNQLSREKDLKKRKRKSLKQDCHRCAMEIRNAYVIAELSRKYANELPGDGDRGELRVFCASNTLYWKHRHVRPAERALPLLRQSGILAIRQHCMGLASESQLRIAMRYLRDHVPDVIRDVELWVRSGAVSASVEQSRAFREVLNALEARLNKDFNSRRSPINNLERSLSERFAQDVYQQRRIREWTRGAVSAGAEWNGWSPASYFAFCRNYGSHDTLKVGPRDWNKEAIAVMSGDLSASWSDFEQNLGETLARIVVFCSATMDWASDHLETIPDDWCSDSMFLLHQAIISRRRVLIDAVEDICHAFQSQLITLRNDAIGGHRTSFFGQGMEDRYTRAIAESGRGSWDRKKAIINSALKNEGLFEGVMKKFRDRFRELAAALQTDIQAAAQANLEVIKGTLDIVRNEDVNFESEEDVAFRARVAEQVRIAKVELERIAAEAGNGWEHE